MDDIAEAQRLYGSHQNVIGQTLKHYHTKRRKIRPNFRRELTEATFVDPYLIKIVDKSVPNRLHRHLRAKGFEDHRPISLAPLSPPKSLSKAFQKEYKREHTKFINQNEKEYLSRQSIKTKLGLLKKPIGDCFELKRNNIMYFQRKYGRDQVKTGRYQERLHPLCNLYERQSQRTIAARLRLSNPFLREEL